MDARQAARNLEVIRTLMERTCQYQLLTARAGLAAGSLAGLGALAFLVLDPADPRQFGLVWLAVFIGSVTAIVVGTVCRSRERGEPVWSRPARMVLRALSPSLFAALVLTAFFFARGDHLWLPGVWMLCYGQAALATAAYAPAPIPWLGGAMLLAGALTLALGPGWAVLLMGLVFGLGHIALAAVLLVEERRQGSVRLHRSVA
jgi:ABC-type Fe3+-siderophore transport system permease subunit